MAKIDLNNIDNIIFDLGGVILNVDYDLTAKAFTELGVKNFNEIYTQLKQNPLFDHLETGSITRENFYKAVRAKTGLNLTEEQIDTAWNAMLLDLPESRLSLLSRLKEKFRLFLLSNTNEIHVKAFTELILKQHGFSSLNDFFEKTYFSNEIGLRKPDPVAFEYIIRENHLDPSRTLFIDDSPQHIEGAKKTGLKTRFLDKGEDICNIF